MKAKQHGAMYLRVLAECECGHHDIDHGKPEQWQLASKQSENWSCNECECKNFTKKSGSKRNK